MTTDLLEERLGALVLDTPDPGRVSARVLSRFQARQLKPSRRWWPRVALVVVAFVVVVALVAYFVPAANTVVARIPVAGDALGARDRITAVGASATSSGYTLTLVGAYADSTRTELLLHSSPAVAFIGQTSTVTDQFGRTYHQANGRSNLLTGDMTVEFEPLAWPDALTGARIALTVTELDLGASTLSSVVRGSWTLQATLGVDEGHALALPTPATLGSAQFQFTAVSYTPATIAIEMAITGANSQDLSRVIPGGLKGTAALGFDVLDSNGNTVTASAEMTDDLFGVSHLRLLAYRDDSGGGYYTLRVSYLGQTFERTLTVS